jgi:hypothetical protein
LLPAAGIVTARRSALDPMRLVGNAASDSEAAQDRELLRPIWITVERVIAPNACFACAMTRHGK